MKNKEVCVVIPVYNKIPEKSELYSIRRTIERLRNRDIVYLAGESLYTSNYHQGQQIRVVKFGDQWFKSTETYSRLLLTKEFYQRFEIYEYILICQTDVFLIGDSDDLQKFLDMNYDYWGAPWYYGARTYRRRCWGYKFLWMLSRPRRVYVGNGGLSLRRVDVMIRFLEKYKKEASYTDEMEDCFIAYYAKYDSSILKTAPLEEAGKFSEETGAREMYKKTGKKPFGIHAWLKYFPEMIFEDEDFK